MSRSVSPARWEAFHLNSAAVCRAGPAAPLLSLATPGLECVFFQTAAPNARYTLSKLLLHQRNKAASYDIGG